MKPKKKRGAPIRFGKDDPLIDVHYKIPASMSVKLTDYCIKHNLKKNEVVRSALAEYFVSEQSQDKKQNTQRIRALTFEDIKKETFQVDKIPPIYPDNHFDLAYMVELANKIVTTAIDTKYIDDNYIDFCCRPDNKRILLKDLPSYALQRIKSNDKLVPSERDPLNYSIYVALFHEIFPYFEELKPMPEFTDWWARSTGYLIKYRSISNYATGY